MEKESTTFGFQPEQLDQLLSICAHGPDSLDGVDREIFIFKDKIYRVNVLGFLVDPDEWDEEFVRSKAAELKMSGSFTERHWQIIRYLRERFRETNSAPTVYQTCKDNGLSIDELQELFPDGYHRGAVKLAGLCVH